MNYDAIILELMDRIKTLEKKSDDYEERLTALEGMTESQAVPDFPATAPRTPAAYATTTDEMIDACYEKGKHAWQHRQYSMNEIKLLAGQVAAGTGMNVNSAVMYIYVVVSMLRGTVYKRAINKAATRRYFERILTEFGPESLQKAVSATRQHIQYRQGLGHQVPYLITLCDQFQRQVDND